jgi:DNA-directed RNA polymerase sigma subunit (sigma70/sigma32)
MVYNNKPMAKYDSLRKLERNRLLLEYREKHPEASIQEIGNVFNISKERARQLLKPKRAEL